MTRRWKGGGGCDGGGGVNGGTKGLSVLAFFIQSWLFGKSIF